MKVFRSIQSYREEKGSFKSWILSIARNSAISTIRRKKPEFLRENIPEIPTETEEESEEDLELLKQAIANCPVKEGKIPYLRPTAILTDRGTFSAAEDFCSIFKSMKRGLIVGTPTGGSTGNVVRVTLEKDLYAHICSKHDYMPDGTEFVGIGIIPDIVIEPTPESYFSPEPNDLVLNKALSTLRSEE